MPPLAKLQQGESTRARRTAAVLWQQTTLTRGPAVKQQHRQPSLSKTFALRIGMSAAGTSKTTWDQAQEQICGCNSLIIVSREALLMQVMSPPGPAFLTSLRFLANQLILAVTCPTCFSPIRCIARSSEMQSRDFQV